MAWRVAEALETLRKQLNEAFPKRSKASDGGIGDAKHASRSSDHNPYIIHKGIGVVSARDFTHDPRTGIDCQWLADTLVKNKDPRIKYIIWNKQICSSRTSPWTWRPYKGVNGHTKHLHLSVIGEAKFYDSTKPWKLDFPKNGKSDVAKISGEANNNTTANAVTAPVVDPPTTTDEPTVSSPDATQTPTANVDTVTVTSPEPYQGIGFIAVIKRDVAAIGGGNLTFQGLSEYAQQASGWPEWLVAILTKFALVALGISVLWIVYRLVHYTVDSWKKAKKVEVEAAANTDKNRFNIEWG